MSKIFISGLINVETSLEVDSFPIIYSPIEYPFNKINTSVSGVGYNIAKALKTLDDDIDLFSIVGDDLNSETIRTELHFEEISDEHLIIYDGDTASSVVLYDKEGKRKIYCDLKDLQDCPIFYHPTQYIQDPSIYDLAVITNISYNRPLLSYFKKEGVCIATDVHIISDIHDAYNQEFMSMADILFLSNEGIKGYEADFIKQLAETYHNQLVVVGLGEEGALAYQLSSDTFFFQKAEAPLGVKNTVGAGDALFSSFIHYYLKTKDIKLSLKYACIFAGIKIATSGGSNGFIDEDELDQYID